MLVPLYVMWRSTSRRRAYRNRSTKDFVPTPASTGGEALHAEGRIETMDQVGFVQFGLEQWRGTSRRRVCRNTSLCRNWFSYPACGEAFHIEGRIEIISRMAPGPRAWSR